MTLKLGMYHWALKLYKVYINDDPGLMVIGPDSSNGRASALGAGGREFDPGLRHTKGVNNGTSGYLACCSAL